MGTDASNLNVPTYSISELLKRLDNLVGLVKSGFDLRVPEVTLGTHQGPLFTGYVTSFDSGSITLVQEINRQHNPSVVVLGAGDIVSIAFEYNECVNELLDPAQPLPYTVDMGPLDFKRLIQKISNEISSKLSSEIQLENTLDAKAETIPHLCNSLNLIKQSILRITSDDLGKQAFKENVSKIQLREAAAVSFELQEKTLLFNILPTGQNLSLSTADASEQISLLL